VSRFVPNPRLDAELELFVAPAVLAAGNAVKERAEVEKHSIMRRRGARPIVIETEGDGVRVTNTDHGAHIDEWGSVNSPPYAPLRRAVRAAGLRLDEHGK
jgi:hypothetical protein